MINLRLGLGDVADRGDSSNEIGESLPAVDLGTGDSADAFGRVWLGLAPPEHVARLRIIPHEPSWASPRTRAGEQKAEAATLSLSARGE
jgi:hypothetical protein